MPQVDRFNSADSFETMDSRVTISIDRLDELSVSESHELDALSHVVYPLGAAGPRGMAWADKQWRVGVWIASGQLVCHVGILLRQILVNGHTIQAGGIGSLMTHPQHRKNGYARKALKAALEWLKANGNVQLALLGCLPHMVKFYENLGWIEFRGSIYIELDGKKERFTYDRVLTFSLDPDRVEKNLVQGTIDLNGLPW